MSRSDVDDDEEEEVEYEEADDSEEQPDSRPRRRATELMFSASGRIALGILGVLLFLGGVALVSKYVFQEDPKIAGDKKSVGDKAKSAQKDPTKTNVVKPNGASGSIPPTSDTQEVDPEGESQPAFRRQPSGSDRYSEYYHHDHDGDTTPMDQGPEAEPIVGTDAPATTTPPANFMEFERDLPVVTPAVASSPQPVREPAPAEPIPATRGYQVHAGESLFDIARYELGSAARWIEIYDLNTASLGDQLESLPDGTRLVIPAQ